MSRKVNDRMLKEKFRLLVEQNPFMQVSDVVYQLLQKEILEIRLSPGTRLNITQLAQQLGISRTPVYSAADQLLAEGLFESSPQRKVYIVSLLNRSVLLELCSARASIEGGAAFLAAQRVTPDDLNTLESLCDQYTALSTAADMSSQAEIDNALHLHLVKASRNSYLIRSYALLRLQLVRYRNYINRLPEEDVREAIRVSQSNHWGIYNALRLHLATVAKEETERDVRNMENILRIL